jgi:NADP-dependent 3-hydroxy acid dehydrogenase YdfG
MDVMFLNNKLSLVTGGCTGLGKAIASCIVQDEAPVVLIGW